MKFLKSHASGPRRRGGPTGRSAIALLLALGLVASACADDEEPAEEPAEEEPAEEPEEEPAEEPEEEPAEEPEEEPEEEVVAAGLDEVCEAGVAEGSFSYWATFAEENFAQIEEVFAETYPGIDIDFLPLRAVESVQRILTEESSGVDLEVDLVNGNLDALQVLVDRELVNQDLDWAALGVQDDWIHPTNMVRIYRVPLGLAYNTDETDPSELPTTWEELIDEKYAGDLVVDPRGNPFKELSLVWGEDDTLDYVRRLKEVVDPVVIEGGTAGMLAVVSGEFMLTAGGRDDSRAELQADGAPIDIQYLDVIPTTDFYNLLIADSEQSNAAACFAGWLMTPEGQAIHTAVEFKQNESIPPGAPEGAEIAVLETSEQAEEVSAVGEGVTAIWTSN